MTGTEPPQTRRTRPRPAHRPGSPAPDAGADAPPAAPDSAEQADVVMRGRDQIAAHPRPRRRPPVRRRGPVQRARRRRRAGVRPAPAGAGRASCRDDLCIAMRVYFEKPRTTIGWKGMINDPHLDDSGDVNTGLRMARGLLLDVARARAAGRLRVPGPDHAAVHLRRRLLGRDRRPDDREPDPPPARVGAVDAGRVQEPHRRQRRRGRRRRARRCGPARVQRRRRHRDPGDPAHGRQ